MIVSLYNPVLHCKPLQAWSSMHVYMRPTRHLSVHGGNDGYALAGDVDEGESLSNQSDQCVHTCIYLSHRLRSACQARLCSPTCQLLQTKPVPLYPVDSAAFSLFAVIQESAHRCMPRAVSSGHRCILRTGHSSMSEAQRCRKGSTVSR